MSKATPSEIGTIHITKTIKNGLKENLDKLKIVLKDDSEFANSLVQKCLLVGDGIYWDNIESLLYKKYCIHDKEHPPVLKQLLDITYNLTLLMAEGDESTKGRLYTLPSDEQIKYWDIFHEEIVHEVHNIFFSSENQNTDMMGENQNTE